MMWHTVGSHQTPASLFCRHASASQLADFSFDSKESCISISKKIDFGRSFSLNVFTE